jgi:hypothetical protein
MRTYLAIFPLFALTLGLIVFTGVFLADVGMSYSTYSAWLSVLLSFTSFISNAAVAYYFAKSAKLSPTLSESRPPLEQDANKNQ